MTEKRFENVGKDILQYGEWYCSAGGEHCAEVIATALNMVTEENEQLKERNNNQYTQLNRLWGLMEDKDWKTMEQMVEEINTAEERLQREWGTYGDVE